MPWCQGRSQQPSRHVPKLLSCSPHHFDHKHCAGCFPMTPKTRICCLQSIVLPLMAACHNTPSSVFTAVRLASPCMPTNKWWDAAGNIGGHGGMA